MYHREYDLNLPLDVVVRNLSSFEFRLIFLSIKTLIKRIKSSGVLLDIDDIVSIIIKADRKIINVEDYLSLTLNIDLGNNIGIPITIFKFYKKDGELDLYTSEFISYDIFIENLTKFDRDNKLKKVLKNEKFK